MKNSIVITFTLAGFHVYLDAPDKVAFLQTKHRHLFKYKVYCEVKGLDRELEFFIVQKEVKSYVIARWGAPCQFGQMSCEMIATEILKHFQDDLNVYKVEVWEDDENGSIVELRQPNSPSRARMQTV